MGVRAVAFDLDDTLCDWSTGIDRALTELTDERTAQRFRAAVRRHAWLRVDGTVLSRRHWMTRRDPTRFWIEALAEPDEAEAERLGREYLTRLRLPLFDDARPTLERLRNKVRLALLSNAPHALERAQELGILGHFDVAMSAPPEYRKPDRRAFETLLDALALTSTEVAYVGDDPLEDVEGATSCGLTAVWLDRIESRWTPPPGTRRVTSLTEVDSVLGL